MSGVAGVVVTYTEGRVAAAECVPDAGTIRARAMCERGIAGHTMGGVTASLYAFLFRAHACSRVCRGVQVCATVRKLVQACAGVYKCVRGRASMLKCA